jgi:hypothetical protein
MESNDDAKIAVIDDWRDCLTALAHNACELLRLAGEPVTLRSLVEVVAAAPRSSQDYTVNAWEWSAFWRAMKGACMKYAGTPDEWRCQELIDYFAKCDTSFDWTADWTTRVLLIEAFIAIAGTIDRELGLNA